jgi:hypothetical protein
MSGVQYGPQLLAIAEDWETYGSTLTDTDGNTWPVHRCRTCDNAIIHEPGTPAGIAYHLITHHGFRMDGRHENEQAIAAEAAAERGEMNAVHRP